MSLACSLDKVVQLPQRRVPRQRLEVDIHKDPDPVPHPQATAGIGMAWQWTWYLQYKTEYCTLSCLKEQCVF